jgi:hypothetical protein
MRSLIIALFVLSAWTASAQDAAQQAMQANQQAMQAAQQATDAAQMANQQAMQANQQAMQAAQQAAQANTCCASAIAATPRFSIKAGTYQTGTTLRLKDSTRGAVIYYTTDGWTPTTSSTRYTGPIVLASTITFQAIAVAPGYMRSMIATAAYTVPGASPTSSPAIEPPISTLSRGTPLPLTFTAAVTSKGLQIGDKLPVALAQDLIVGGVLVAPKSTPVLATVMQVDNPGIGGAPGTLTFAVHSITLTDGETIPLSGTETKEGQSRMKTVRSLIFIPAVGVSGLFIHGKDVQIPQGATFTAFVDSGNPHLTAKSIP